MAKIERVEGTPVAAAAVAATAAAPKVGVDASVDEGGSGTPPAVPPDETDASTPVELVTKQADGSFVGKLDDGRTLVFARPSVATQFLVYEILGSNEALRDSNAAHLLTRGLMYLRSIDGVEQKRPQNRVEAQKLMNTLGDEGTDFVTNVYVNYFVLKRADLPKSVRQ